MELKILEQAKKRLIIRMDGTGDSLCNALVEELWKDTNVDAASYAVRHPLVGVPELLVEVKTGEPKKALSDATKRLLKVNEKLKKEFMKELK